MERFNQLYGIRLTQKKTHEIIFMLMALEVIFAFSYFGYIDFPMISTTTLHVIVIVAAMILGVKGSVPVVCVFAVTSVWISTYAATSFDRSFSPFVSGTPSGSVMLVFARILFAIISAILFGFYFRRKRRVTCIGTYIGISVIAAVSTFLLGLIVLGVYGIFFPDIYHALTANIISSPLCSDWMSYVSAALGCCILNYILSNQNAKAYLSCLCESRDSIDGKSYRRALMYAKLCAGVIGISCVMYLRKRIFGELNAEETGLAAETYINITVFITQLLCAFACLFGIVTIIIRWINEYYSVQRVKMDQKLAEQSVRISIDALTGVYSRFAYHEAIEEYSDHAQDDFAAFLIDINGLKKVNDSSGHEAGDELICGAADCLIKAVGDKGRIFRIGGDEFVVFGRMNKKQAEETLTKLDKIVNSWSGKKVESLSISVGCAPSCDFAGYSVENLVKEADKLMYRQKQEYYRKKRANARKGN